MKHATAEWGRVAWAGRMEAIAPISNGTILPPGEEVAPAASSGVRLGFSPFLQPLGLMRVKIGGIDVPENPPAPG